MAGVLRASSNGTVLVNPLLNDQGFYVDFNQWQAEQVVKLLRPGQQLTEEHWQVIHNLRQFYQLFQRSPNMRLLVKSLQAAHPDIANSIRLMQLFGESPAREACRLSGLPKPKNCL